MIGDAETLLAYAAHKVHANDLWVAACAVHYRVPLLTRNGRHFGGLPGFEVVE